MLERKFNSFIPVPKAENSFAGSSDRCFSSLLLRVFSLTDNMAFFGSPVQSFPDLAASELDFKRK